MQENKGRVEDISREIERTALEDMPVTKDIAEKEEEISRAVVKILPTKDEIELRKEKAIIYLKKKKDLIFYIILAFIVYIGVYIRRLNIPKLKDITTGTWTLGPDLDPFLFLRWAKYIVQNGTLMANDAMRYVPLGYNPSGEMKLLSYMIAWFHKGLSMFGLSDSITYSAIIFPVFMFALTAIAFFLFARKVFHRESKNIRNIIALLATFLFVLVPSLLPRTIAGIPEKESAAFFFMFMTFYFFIEAFTSEKLKRGLIFGILAGISTAAMALIWGGASFIFFAIAAATIISFIFEKIKIKEFFIYSSWVISSFALMMPFSTRYSIKNLISSSSTGSVIFVLLIMGISLFIMKNDSKFAIRKKIKLPKEIFALIVSTLIIFILVTPFFGIGFVFMQVSDVTTLLIKPIETRFGLTVAENKQPFFHDDWENSFGPIYFGIPLYFWMFFIGSIVLFYELVSKLGRKEKIMMTFGYFVFLIGLIFSKYSSGSSLNGENFLSVLVYFGGILFFLSTFFYFYFKRYWIEGLHSFKTLEFSYILYFLVLTLGIIAARSAIRLVMVLGAVTPLVVAFLTVKTTENYFKSKDELFKLFIGLFAFIFIVFSILILVGSPFSFLTGKNFGGYLGNDISSGKNFVPSAYQWQWQKAMGWVRTNTPENSVFAHWWDYGYWVQSIGERATILDGGNAIVYWNHLLGRYVLTGTDENKALEFLYTHNATHLLIDSTEIGKYTAYSSIGADENYDRFSWIPTLSIDASQTIETKNETAYLYRGGSAIDEDIVWEIDGKKILLPKKNSFIGGMVLKINNKKEYLQPEGIFIYQDKTYKIPLRYLYVEDKLIDFNSGLEAGIFIFPSLESNNNGQIGLNKIGTAMYLSKRTVNSMMVRLYLFDTKSDYFKLVHKEKNIFIADLEAKGMTIGDFVYYQGFQGPIKIWEISYPEDIEKNPEFLKMEYPNSELKLAKPGEY